MESGEKDSFDLSVFIREFEVRRHDGFAAAEAYLTSHSEIADAVRKTLYADVTSGKLSSSLLEWLYNCAVSRGHSKALFTFVLQFVPDLMYVYLHSIVENTQQLKVPTEALLLGIVKEVDHKKPTHARTHSLSRPSIYHQSTARVTQPSLTEAALIRHNQSDTSSTSIKTTFTDTEVNGSNRLIFLTAVVDAFSNSITSYLPSTLTAFCNSCTRFAVQGMHTPFLTQLKEHYCSDGCLSADTVTALGKRRRLPINDTLLASLLHSLRMCLFQSCHNSAVQALNAMKMRAEYEELPVSLQISHAMLRINKEVTPLKLPLDPSQHMTYSDKDSTWACRPVTVMRSILGQVLHSRLDLTKHTPSSNLYSDLAGESFCAQSDSVIRISVKDPEVSQSEDEDDEEDDDDGEYLTPTEVSIEFVIGSKTAVVDERDEDSTSESDAEVNKKSTADSHDQLTSEYKVSSV